VIPRSVAAALLSAALAACTHEPAPSTTEAVPAAAPATETVDIQAEAQKAAAAIDESNADAELERIKAELQSE
jgi:hypothetical protein